jgi:hypothetical protein
MRLGIRKKRLDTLITTPTTMRSGKRHYDKEQLHSSSKKVRIQEPDQDIDDSDLLEKSLSFVSFTIHECI